MAEFFAILVNEIKDLQIPLEEAKEANAVIQKLLTFPSIQQGQNILVASSYDIECVHLANTISQTLKVKFYLSQNLSTEIEGRAICSPDISSRFPHLDSMNTRLNFSSNLEDIQQFRLQSSKIYQKIIIITSSIFQREHFQNHYKYQQGNFALFLNHSISLDEEQENSLEQIRLFAKRIQDECLMLLGDPRHHSDSSSLQNCWTLLKKIKTAIQENEQVVNELCSKFLNNQGQSILDQMLQTLNENCNRSLLLMNELREDVHTLMQKAKKEIPMELENPGKCIQIHSFFYSSKNDGWQIILTNNSNYSIRDLNVIITLQSETLLTISCLQSKMTIKKTIKRPHIDQVYYETLSVYHKGRQVSEPYIINPVQIIAIHDSNDQFECILKNRSFKEFKNLKVCSTHYEDPLAVITEVLSYKQVSSVVVKHPLSQYNGSHIIIYENDFMISNKVEVKLQVIDL